MQSAFNPTSTNNPVLPFSLGRSVAMVGLKTPLMGLILNIAPTNMAPVLPALKKASISPVTNNLKPIAIDEFGFSFKALVGCSW